MQFSDISHVLASKYGKPHILQPAQPCTIHTDEISHDEWNKAADKTGFPCSFTLQSELFPGRTQPQDIFSGDLRCKIVCTMFDSDHLSRKLKKAHKYGFLYRRNTKWKRRLSSIILNQQVEFAGRMCSSEFTPDGTAWDFTIKSETRD